MAKKDKSQKDTSIFEVELPETTEQTPVTNANRSPLNSLAVVSFATAISWVGAVAGIITGHVALSQIKRSGERGRGLAIAGLVLGYLYIAGAIAFSVLMLCFRARGYAVSDSYGNMGGHFGPGMMGGHFGPGMMGDQGFDGGQGGPGMGFNH